MDGFITILKMNLKLLFRNKGYLTLLIILPIISVFMLHIQIASSVDGNDTVNTIYELQKEESMIFNVEDNKWNIKVYDCSHSKTSDYLLQELADTGFYRIYRYKSAQMSETKRKQQVLYSMNKNVLGAVIYIPKDFETKVLEGKKSDITLYQGRKDPRISLLQENLNSYLQSMNTYAKMTDYNAKNFNQVLKNAKKNEIKKQIITVKSKDALNLSSKQQSYSSSIGYSVAFLTIGFLFSGVMIASTVIEEKQNKVYQRIVLSKFKVFSYVTIKMLLMLFTVALHTAFLAILLRFFMKVDFGISYRNYIFLVFCFGLIFNSLSVVIGILTNNVLTANYMAFFVWCISNILAGAYFPIDATSKWFLHASLLMPQRWVIKTAEMLMLGKSNVYPMYLLVVFGYLIIIFTVGFIGIRISKKE